MPAIKLQLPFPEKVCFVSNRAVLMKRKPVAGETPEQALTEHFYLTCNVYDSTKSSSIRRAEINQQNEYDKIPNKNIWEESSLRLSTLTPPTRKVVDNNPFTAKFMGFLYEKTTAFAKVVLGEEAYMVTVPLGEFTEAVRLGGISANGDMGCKFVFHNEGPGSIRLIPIGSSVYNAELKKQDKTLDLEENSRYLSVREITAGNVYRNEVTKENWLCIGWRDGKVLGANVGKFPDNNIANLAQAEGRYNQVLSHHDHYWQYSNWVTEGIYSQWRKNPPNLTKQLFGVGGPENVNEWRKILRGFATLIAEQAEGRKAAEIAAQQTQYRNYYGASTSRQATAAETILTIAPKLVALSDALFATKKETVAAMKAAELAKAVPA